MTLNSPQAISEMIAQASAQARLLALDLAERAQAMAQEAEDIAKLHGLPKTADTSLLTLARALATESALLNKNLTLGSTHIVERVSC